MRDAEHPGGKLPLAPIGVLVFEHSQEHILHHVFTRLSVTGVHKKEVEQSRVKFIKKCSQLIDITISYRQHSLMVRQ